MLRYAIVVLNGGPGTAQAVTVTDPLPAGTVFVELRVEPGHLHRSAGRARTEP